MFVVVSALITAIPVAFIVGRVSDPSRTTIRGVESLPVPRELPPGIDRFHDATAGVTCWRVTVQGLPASVSCLPDAVLDAAWVPRS